MDIILFLAAVFFVIYVIGKLLEKIRIPWLFSALLIGFGLAIYNPFTDVTNSPIFIFLAQLGMMFLLFIIGFELKFLKIIKHDTFIIKGAFVVILAETFVGTLIMHYIFDVSWLISLLVASSFSTVGEAVLLPILDEFKLTNTKLGQTILGIGVIDDVLELGTIIAAIIVISLSEGHTNLNILATVSALAFCFVLVYAAVRFHKEIHTFKFKDIPSFFLFVLFFIFLFVGLGRFVEAGALGAILAGIALQNIVPEHNIKYIDSEIRTMSYGFLAPIFFLWVGINTDFKFLSGSFMLVALVVLCTGSAKIASMYFFGKKHLGSKRAIVVGVGLTVKLSTSIVILKLLFENSIITSELYSVLIAASIIFAILPPLLLPIIIKKWKIHLEKD